MDTKLTLWITILFIGIGYWFYSNLSPTINYKRHPQLIDQMTGAKRKPSDLLHLGRIINITQEYINSTNAQQRLYELEYYSNFENPFLIDHSYSNKQDLILSGQPVADQQACGQQLSWLLSQLNQHKDYTLLTGQLGYELTNYMDSFGKPQSGLYGGVVSSLGSYKQCLKTSLDWGKIKTRFCIGRMRPKWWPTNETIYPRTTIRLGLCLPETCDSQSINIYGESIETLSKWELTDLYKGGWRLESMFCLPDERSPVRAFPSSGKIYLFVVLGWILFVILASIIHELYYRSRRRSERRTSNNKIPKITFNDQRVEMGGKPIATSSTSLIEKLLEAFSLRSSLKAYKTNTFRVNYARGHRVRVNLGGLDFFKINMAMLIVLGHSGYLAGIYARSLSYRIELYTLGMSKMALSIARCVDSFYLFFGVLTTYTMMRKSSPKQLANPLVWVAINLGILLRVGPVFMLVYWFSRSVSPYMGSGPWWDYGVDEHSMKGVCMSDAWWKSIPYFGSIGSPPVPTCILPAWFIVSYSQLSLILPLITYIIYKLPNQLARFIFTCLLVLVSALNIGVKLYQQTSVKEEAFTIYGGFLSDLLEKFESSGYLTTLSRLGAASTGCWVGYLLRRYEEGHISKWPNWLTNSWTILGSLVTMVVIVMLPLIGHFNFLLTGRLISLEEFVGFNTAILIVWPFLNAIVVICGTTIYNHMVVIRFFSHSFWHAFNRLGFGIYLVHWEVLFMGFTSFEQGPSYGFGTDVMKMWSFGLFLSILIAFLINLFLEAPLTKLTSVMTAPYIKTNSLASSCTGKAEEKSKSENLTIWKIPNGANVV